MAISQRNFVYPLLIILVGVMLLLVALGVLPPSIEDFFARSWAIVLVLFGLDFLIRGRVPVIGNNGQSSTLFAGLLAAILLGLVVYSGYAARIDTPIADHVEVLNPVPLGDHIQGVNITVESLNATVVFQPTQNLEQVVAARYEGSDASDVRITAQEDANGYVNLTVIESRDTPLPALEDVGRGELIITLPVGLPIQNASPEEPGLTFTNKRGLVTLDFQAVEIPRFDIHNESGDVDLYMPVRGLVIGDVRVDEGNLMVVALPDIPLRVSNVPSNIEWNDNNYSALVGGIIESKGGFDSFQMNLRVELSNGGLTIISPQELSNQREPVDG